MYLPKKLSLTSHTTVIYKIGDQEISDVTSCANSKFDLYIHFPICRFIIRAFLSIQYFLYRQLLNTNLVHASGRRNKEFMNPLEQRR